MIVQQVQHQQIRLTSPDSLLCLSPQVPTPRGTTAPQAGRTPQPPRTSAASRSRRSRSFRAARSCWKRTRGRRRTRPRLQKAASGPGGTQNQRPARRAPGPRPLVVQCSPSALWASLHPTRHRTPRQWRCSIRPSRRCRCCSSPRRGPPPSTHHPLARSSHQPAEPPSLSPR